MRKNNQRNVPPRRARQAKDTAQRADLVRASSVGTGGPVVRSVPHFHVKQIVCVSESVFESGVARIVGMEWLQNSWRYWLIEVFSGGSPWAAGESELLKWAKG